jgi:hypothetical protein
MNTEPRNILKLTLWGIVYLIALVAICMVPPPARAADNPDLSVLVDAVRDLTGIDFPAPEFVWMNTEMMKADGCVHPDDCPTLVSVHPPLTDRIIVNSDIELARDLNAQGQIVHVLTMYLLEKAGKYHPSQPCSLVLRMEAWAENVQAAFMDVMTNRYIGAGLYVPPPARPDVWTFCTPDEKPAPMEVF